MLQTVTAQDEETPQDLFFFPPRPPALNNDYLKATFHVQDVLNVNWETSVGYANLQYLCCRATLCTSQLSAWSTMIDMTKLSVVLYSLNNATGIHDGYWAFNFTLTFGTGNDCYMRLDQPLRGLHKGIESEHFIVADSVSPSLFWQQNGSTPLDPNGEQSTYGSALSPALSLPTDGDATQFPDQCLALDKHFEADCWSALRLPDWIPEWVKYNTPIYQGQMKSARISFALH